MLCSLWKALFEKLNIVISQIFILSADETSVLFEDSKHCPDCDQICRSQVFYELPKLALAVRTEYVYLFIDNDFVFPLIFLIMHFPLQLYNCRRCYNVTFSFAKGHLYGNTRRRSLERFVSTAEQKRYLRAFKTKFSSNRRDLIYFKIDQYSVEYLVNFAVGQ